MTVETPIEMLHLPQSLRALFSGKVPEAATGTPEERKKNFQSRALAAYAIHKLGGATLDEAVACMIDGDGGIDAEPHFRQSPDYWVQPCWRYEIRSNDYEHELSIIHRS